MQIHAVTRQAETENVSVWELVNHGALGLLLFAL